MYNIGLTQPNAMKGPKSSKVFSIPIAKKSKSPLQYILFNAFRFTSSSSR